MNHMRGVTLVHQCQEHLLEVMRSLPECLPGGDGRPQNELASAAGFLVAGDRRDTWFVGALLGRLEGQGKVEALLPAGRGSKRFRLRNQG